MFADLLNSSYFALFLIVALGFMLGKIKIKGLSLDVSAVIFIALLFGHFGVVIPKELGNFGLVLFIFTIGIQAGPGFFDSFRSKGKTLIIITMLIICSHKPLQLQQQPLRFHGFPDVRCAWQSDACRQ